MLNSDQNGGDPAVVDAIKQLQQRRVRFWEKTQGSSDGWGSPPCMRGFLPMEGHLVGCYIFRSTIKHFWCGYYPSKVANSHTEYFLGPRAPRTELEALSSVVTWMWDQHFIEKGIERPDNTYPTEHTVNLAHKHYADLKLKKAASARGADGEEMDEEGPAEGRGRGRAKARGRGRGRHAPGRGRGAKEAASEDAPEYSPTSPADEKGPETTSEEMGEEGPAEAASEDSSSSSDSSGS